MLLEITSDDERFKTIKLGPGLNILLADKTLKSADTDSRNGAGKSSFVEIIHYLLGMGNLKDSALKNTALGAHSFTLRMEWPKRENELSVSRTAVSSRLSNIVVE